MGRGNGQGRESWGDRKEGKASPAPDLRPQALRTSAKSGDRQGGSNNGINVLFMKNIQKIPERKGQRSLVEAIGGEGEGAGDDQERHLLTPGQQRAVPASLPGGSLPYAPQHPQSCPLPLVRNYLGSGSTSPSKCKFGTKAFAQRLPLLQGSQHFPEVS